MELFQDQQNVLDILDIWRDDLVPFALGCSLTFEADLIADGYYRLAECSGCGLVYQVEAPDSRLAERLYGVWIDPAKSFEVYERRKSIGYYEGRVDRILAVVKWLDKDPCDLRVLDYSMGWGQWARIGAALGLGMCGTEYTEAKREHARRMGVEVIEESDLAPASFDWVNADQVLEHVPDSREVFQRLCGLVRVGGVLSLSVPYGDDIQRRIERLDWGAGKHSLFSLMPVQPLEHLNCFNRAMLDAALAEAGFRRIDLDRAGPFYRVYRSGRALAGRVVRRALGRERPPLTIDLLAVRAR